MPAFFPFSKDVGMVASCTFFSGLAAASVLFVVCSGFSSLSCGFAGAISGTGVTMTGSAGAASSQTSEQVSA